jgi:hypothetical protein
LQSISRHATVRDDLVKEARLSDSEPIPLRRGRQATRPTVGSGSSGPLFAASAGGAAAPRQVRFTRAELMEILSLYGRMVAAGEWRDYAIDFGAQKAVFSVFRRATEYPLYRIEKNPQLARKQGAYSVVATNGLILKRGQDLGRVLDVLDKKLKPVG